LSIIVINLYLAKIS